jgi:hypothetical protein
MHYDISRGKPDPHGFSNDDDNNSRSCDSPQDHHADKPVTVDQADIATYLHFDGNADGSFSEQIILQVKGFELNGSPVSLPGFGTYFGMYFLVDATGHSANGVVSFDSMNIALMVDRGNNDGTPSSTEFGGVTFASGTRGDYALANGTLSSAVIQVDPDGTRHPNSVEVITTTKAGEQVFGASLQTGDFLREVLTTPGGPQIFQLDGGESIQVVNGTGFGIAELSPQAPFTIRPDQLSETAFRATGFPFGRGH